MSLKHLELITAKSMPAEKMTLFDGVLLIAQGADACAAIWIGTRWFKPGDLETAHEKLINSVNGIEGFKIVGTPALLSKTVEWLTNKRLKVINQAVRSGSFEVRFNPIERRIQITKKIRVLVVDDSRTIRNLLTKILSSDLGIEVVGTAEKPSDARELIAQLRPDVITLDLHMPEMDGLAFLKEFLPEHPIPTVMITSVSAEEGPQVLSCLEFGAVDYIQKPSAGEITEITPFLIEKVKTAASVKVVLNVNAGRQKKSKHIHHQGHVATSRDTLLAIGSSTGGTEALRKVLTNLPASIPPTVIVQHIPPVFSRAFADRMNDLCEFRVKEAEDGEEILSDTAYIAPGGKQMGIRKRPDGRIFVKIEDSEPVNRHKPSVDFLFDTVVEAVGGNCIGVILTGMGADGAKGLKKLRNAGARTIAQDEKSCVVFGMPREAIKLDAAIEILDIHDIAGKILSWIPRKKAA
jgi:two-component system chemotaxis response regulator CheB